MKHAGLPVLLVLLAPLVLGLALTGCGDDGEESVDPTVVREARELREFLTDDPVLLPLEEAEDVVSRDLPVRAADMLRSGAIPAARRALEEIQVETFETPEVERLRSDASDAYAARLAAIEQYADVLEAGGEEDLVLVESLRAQRQAEEALARVLDALEELAPTRDAPSARTPDRPGSGGPSGEGPP